MYIFLTCQEYKKITGRGSGGNYSGFGDVFHGAVDTSPLPIARPGPGYWPGPGSGPSHGPGAGLGHGGHGGPLPDNVYYQQHQQANMMANRYEEEASDEDQM